MAGQQAHCTYCGARFTAGQEWPRRCGACGETTYRNPTPVAVALQPVGDGLLAVRRAIPPAEGTLALPGGFIELGETWQAATTRELREETGLIADPARVRLFDTLSAEDGTLLVFGLLPAIPAPIAVPEEPIDGEALELAVLTGPAELGFSLHTEVADRWFSELR
ncbi:NUDIX domain-containing protein [Actinoplanes sp. NPDC051851]|uniref:NUDIX domain-containing protein n=1 Tax=Actinoplanes sp. NPDC051851 TaxID=3154753 RepID=UPI00343B4DAE